ncbi:MAG TPA: glycosyltransferase family 4 protein [Bryobacteraceae bacterium]|nr:glycosyltransferase family 4 protein [Bryobacteraceae bacterium]
MRILLTANASYNPPRGGATRSNLLWLEHMAAAGDRCRVVAGALAESAAKRAQIAQEGLDREPPAHRGVEIFEAQGRAGLGPALRYHIQEFEPDWVLVSSEDLGHVLLREAHHAAPGRVVYLAHTPQFFPFGPASWNPDQGAADLVRRAAGVVAIGHHAAAYIAQHLGRAAEVIHPPIYGSEPFPNLARFGEGLITMVNPCAVKGISIFLGLADRFPAYGFGVLPGWGTTAEDRAALAARANITVLPNCRHIAEFLSRTRILLMPSLWYEGFGLTVMEAMLHGIPVISSDAGGLVEAKMGTPFVAHAPAIERYEHVFDEHSLPKPVAGTIDFQPWTEALCALLRDRSLYERVSDESRAAALRFVRSLAAGRMREYLQSLVPAVAAPERPSLANLSPDKRALLLRLARGRKV